MNGKYKTPDGQEVIVLEFDEPNQIAYTRFHNEEKRWVGKQEYSQWVKGDEEVVNDGSEEIADMIAPTIEVYEKPIGGTKTVDTPKKKKVVKKAAEKKEVKKTVKKKTKK